MGIVNKSGFKPFRYDAFIGWAKSQGPASPYRRLYTPLRSSQKKHDAEQKNLCERFRLKSKCVCRVEVFDSFKQTNQAVIPTKEGLRLWKESKNRFGKADIFLRPACPSAHGLCPLYLPFKDLDALRERALMVLHGGEQWLKDVPKLKAAKPLTAKHCMELQYNPRFADIDYDEELLMATNGLDDLEREVPLRQPEESYVEYTPTEFFDIYGFEMEDFYVESRFSSRDFFS